MPSDGGARRWRVITVDDHCAFRETLGMALALDDDIEWVGSAATAEEALALVGEVEVDVVLLDFHLAGMDGIECTRRIKASRPEARVVLLTGFADFDTMLRAVAAGCEDLLLKAGTLQEIRDAIRRVDGERGMSPDTLERLGGRVRDAVSVNGQTWRPALTRREKDVLAGLAAGLEPKAIARQLGIRIATTRTYVRDVLGKLGAHSQLEAVAVARHCGLLDDLDVAGQRPRFSTFDLTPPVLDRLA